MILLHSRIKQIPGDGSTQGTLPSDSPTAVVPSSLEVFFVGNTPQINCTTLTFISNTNRPVSVSCALRPATGTSNCQLPMHAHKYISMHTLYRITLLNAGSPGELTVIKDLTLTLEGYNQQ